MARYTSILYQIVYSTKYRTPCMHKEMRPELFKYIWGIMKNKKCHLYRINGAEDHIHILTDLHPTIALSGLIKDIKLASTKMIKEHNLREHEENNLPQMKPLFFLYVWLNLTRILPVFKENLVKHIRKRTIQTGRLFFSCSLITNFPGWQVGYGAFTYDMNAKDNLIEYIKNQEEHHRKVTFKEEYINLLKEHGIDYDEKYLFED